MAKLDRECMRDTLFFIRIAQEEREVITSGYVVNMPYMKNKYKKGDVSFAIQQLGSHGLLDVIYEEENILMPKRVKGMTTKGTDYYECLDLFGFDVYIIKYLKRRLLYKQLLQFKKMHAKVIPEDLLQFFKNIGMTE